MKIQFRQMQFKDLQFFNRIRNISANMLHDSTEYTYSECAHWFINTCDSIFYIVSVDGVDIGYFRTSYDDMLRFYVGLDIDPMYRGNGYATQIYNEFYRQYPNRVKDGTYLKVLGKNIIAKKLYDKLGYVELGRTFNDSHQCDDIFMYRSPYSNQVVGDVVARICNSCAQLFKAEYNDAIVIIHGVDGFIGKWLHGTLASAKQQGVANVNIFISDINTLDIRDSNAVLSYYTDIALQFKQYNDILLWGSPRVFVFNCTGIANPSKYLSKPIDTLDVSYGGTKNVLHAVQVLERLLYTNSTNRATVMMFSSSEIYGNPSHEDIPSREQKVGVLQPESSRACYDVGKLVLETTCNVFMEKDDVDIRIIRPFNWYGPLMHDDRVVPNLLSRAITGEPLLIYGDGMQTRSYCYVADAISILFMISSKYVAPGPYNIGNDDGEITVSDLAETINSVCNSTSTLRHIEYPVTYPADEPARRSPCMKKTFSAIGAARDYQFVNLHDGIQETKIYLQQLNATQ